MFNVKIVDSAKFLKMPSTSQLLYFHLCLRADDDGVVEAFNVLRMTGLNEDDLKILITKGYVQILNDDLVSFITDWKEHNLIRADRKVDSIYKELLLRIIPRVELTEPRERADTKKRKEGHPKDNQRTTKGQHSIGKVSIGKVSINNSISKDILVPKDLVSIAEKWNSLNLSKIVSIKGTRLKMLNSRIKEYGHEKVIEAIENIHKSSFLKGQNKKSWTITFDWLIKPNNFPKVLENNYSDKDDRQQVNYQSKVQANIKACGDIEDYIQT